LNLLVCVAFRGAAYDAGFFVFGFLSFPDLRYVLAVAFRSDSFSLVDTRSRIMECQNEEIPSDEIRAAGDRPRYGHSRIRRDAVRENRTPERP
jgi:hypothetical protein